MNNKIQIKIDSPFWVHQEQISIRGHLWYNGLLYKESDLIKLLDSISEKTELIALLQKANGQFSGIIQKQNFTCIFVDRLRSFPLFYREEKEQIIVSNHTSLFRKEAFDLNINAIPSFLSSGYCHGNQTLIKDVYQVQAGEILFFLNNTWQRFTYFSSFTNKFIIKEIKGLVDIFSIIAKDLVLQLDGRQAIIPLSGGYDSRLILAMLHRENYQNIVTFTYGKKDSHEVRLAEKVTSYLRVKWIPISYDHIVPPDFLNDADFQEYYPFAANDSSMPYLQDFFAVQRLVKEQMIDLNGVFLPGHTGDILSGGHLSSEMNQKFSRKKCIDKILEDHCHLIDKYKSTLLEDLTDSVSIEENILEWNRYENWDIKERQSKFIVNSVRVFEFFGHDFLIPLWDKRLMDYFLDLDFEQKFNSQLYKDTLRNEIFSPVGILYDDEMQISIYRRKWQSFKEKMKKKLPKSLINLFIDHSDPHCYGEVIKLMIIQDPNLSFYPPKQANLWNAYISQWYLWQIFGQKA